MAKTIAIQGGYGAFHEIAAYHFFQGEEIEILPRNTFRDMVSSLKGRKSDFGIMAIENSLAGSIHENYDLLLEYDFRIIGEITLRIMHHLIGHPGAELQDVKRVFSHPQVFQQCRQFLDRHDGWELVSARDTATAVKQIKEEGALTAAAIASKEAGEIHGMVVMEEGIETNPRNYTRFVVIGTQQLENGPRHKSSLIYSTGNRPGALFETLKVFSEQGINLVKLESRPIHGKPWEYMFYVDVEADVESDSFKPVLRRLEENTDYLRILGSY